jgi:hypothetical protein
MPPLGREDVRKLRLFVAVVVGLLAVILAANVAVHDRTSLLVEGAGTPMRAGLERLAANPTVCAMTMLPSPDKERPMRHANAALVGKLDVLVLGQSDADHMSKTFFKDSVAFYNGFVSNSYYVLEYEVFEDLVALHGAPKLVLFDARSGFVLRPFPEPGWDSPPKDDPIWWGFPPFHLGRPKPPPWYKDIPSLLSLAQTELTLTWLSNQLPARTPPSSGAGAAQTDNGDQFRCVPITQKSKMNRWLADGSRVYEDELDGVLVSRGAVHIDDSVGKREVNDSRLVGLEFVLSHIQQEGSTIIVYAPPINPVAFDDPRNAPALRAAAARIKGVTDRLGIDYCDLTAAAATIGCTASDFADELHVSRHCDARVVRQLALGCAPRAGGMLKEMLNDETLR